MHHAVTYHHHAAHYRASAGPASAPPSTRGRRLARAVLVVLAALVALGAVAFGLWRWHANRFARADRATAARIAREVDPIVLPAATSDAATPPEPTLWRMVIREAAVEFDNTARVAAMEPAVRARLLAQLDPAWRDALPLRDTRLVELAAWRPTRAEQQGGYDGYVLAPVAARLRDARWLESQYRQARRAVGLLEPDGQMGVTAHIDPRAPAALVHRALVSTGEGAFLVAVRDARGNAGVLYLGVAPETSRHELHRRDPDGTLPLFVHLDPRGYVVTIGDRYLAPDCATLTDARAVVVPRDAAAGTLTRCVDAAQRAAALDGTAGIVPRAQTTAAQVITAAAELLRVRLARYDGDPPRVALHAPDEPERGVPVRIACGCGALHLRPGTGLDEGFAMLLDDLLPLRPAW